MDKENVRHTRIHPELLFHIKEEEMLPFQQLGWTRGHYASSDKPKTVIAWSLLYVESINIKLISE